jgi:hypothetical protein
VLGLLFDGVCFEVGGLILRGPGGRMLCCLCEGGLLREVALRRL